MIPYALLCLFGIALIVGAFNSNRLIARENRHLTRLADRVKAWRERLEAEQGGAS
jgi:hypothetical protein